jgi:ferredoxin
MEELSRRNFVGMAATVAAAVPMAGSAFADEKSAVSSAADAASAAKDGETQAAATDALTFNGGALTSAEQHATLDSYDWTTDRLTVQGIAEQAKEVSDEEAQAILDNEPTITQDYVQADGTVVPAVYIMLRNRLQRLGQGVGNEVKDGCWDYLMHNFTEDEAAFYLKLPMYRYFNDEEAGEAAGMSSEDAKDLCDDLSYRGLLNRVTRAGVNFYHTLAYAHGMLEFTMNRYEEDGYLNDVFGMLGADYSYTSRNQGSAMYYTVPVEKDVLGETEVLPYTDWEKIIDRNEVLAVSPCQCRTFKPLMKGMKPGELCDHPLETCISTGEQAQYYIENGIGRQIDKDEAKQIIQNSVDAGMVIEVMNTKQCDVICSCHGDCCAILSGYIAMGGDVENLKYVSNYQLEVDREKCIKCGACVDRCPMFTIEMTDDGPQVGNLCVRCGQCATVCPVGARKLVARPEDERVELPNSMIDDYRAKALERAKRGYIKDFDPAKVQAQ